MTQRDVADGRPHDIAVYGTTSFVGEIICRYLVDRLGVDRLGSDGGGVDQRGDVAWAIAGRNPDKLAEVAERTGANVPVIVADADDDEALAELCASTRVVASTVGPYARYGSKLVAAVADGGPAAVAAAKVLVRDVAGAPLTAALVEDTAARIADIRASAEGREGVAAFLESRPPNWRGA